MGGILSLESEILPRAIRGECMQICAEFQFLRLDQLLVIALALIQEIQFRLDSYTLLTLNLPVHLIRNFDHFSGTTALQGWARSGSWKRNMVIFI